MPRCFDQEFTVYQFECDPWDRMTPGAALRRSQEVSNAHCDDLGLTFEVHQRNHTVFLLSRISFLVKSHMPALYEDVRIQTRAYGPKGPSYHRVNAIYSSSGETLCEMDTRWTLVDTETNRILRTPPPDIAGYFNELPEEEHSLKMPKPGSLVDLGEHRATYSLCDRNGHINNACYADIMCDHLPIEQLERGTPRRMLFFYRAEIPFNHTFSLHCGATTDPEGQNGYYFLAADGDTKNFEGYVSF